MSITNPITVLVDVSGSQLGTASNPFVVSSSAPPIVINNNVNYITQGSDSNASYVLATTTGSLPGGVAHELLRQLIHLSDDDGPRGSQWSNNLVKDTGPQPFPTASIWYADSSRTQKIVEQIIVRNSNMIPLTIQWKAYALDGTTVVESYTDTFVYSGIFETSRTRSQP